jgi:hypothetical protein
MLRGMNNENLLPRLTLTPHRRSVDLSSISIYAGREYLSKLTITSMTVMGSRAVGKTMIKLAFTQL